MSVCVCVYVCVRVLVPKVTTKVHTCIDFEVMMPVHDILRQIINITLRN